MHTLRDATGPRLSLASAAILLVACAACSSNDAAPSAVASTDGGIDSTAPLRDASVADSAPPLTDATTADGAGPDGPVEDSATSEASPSDAGDDGGTSPFTGAIFATSDTTTAADGGARVDYSAGGYFVHRTAPDQSVTSTTVGPCLVQIYGSGAGPVETKQSAGTVHVAGGKKTIALVPNGTKEYATVQGTDSDLWNGGETITVTADGADVPAFTTSLVAPSILTLTTPALPATSGALSVARNAPFAATWTGASSGVVVLYFDAADASNAYAATCTFAASAGSAQVPAAAFTSFPAGAGTFNFYGKTTSAPALSGWTIHFNASRVMVDGKGLGATGSTSYL